MEPYCTEPPNMGPHCTGTPPLLVTSGSHHWISVQTSSLHFPTITVIWWLLKHIQLAQVGDMHTT